MKRATTGGKTVIVIGSALFSCFVVLLSLTTTAPIGSVVRSALWASTALTVVLFVMFVLVAREFATPRQVAWSVPTLSTALSALVVAWSSYTAVSERRISPINYPDTDAAARSSADVAMPHFPDASTHDDAMPDSMQSSADSGPTTSELVLTNQEVRQLRNLLNAISHLDLPEVHVEGDAPTQPGFRETYTRIRSIRNALMSLRKKERDN